MCTVAMSAQQNNYSVVSLEDDLLAVPAELLLKQLAVGVDHLVQAADVGLHVTTSSDDVEHVVLNVTAKSLPFVSATAECRNIVEVGVGLLDGPKLIAVIKSGFVARAVHEPKLWILIPFRFLEQPVNHAPKRSDPGASRNEDAILARLAEGEHSVRPVELNRCSHLKVAQPIGEKTVLDAVQAEVK